MGVSQGLTSPVKGPVTGAIPRPPTITEANGFGVYYSRLGVLIYGGQGGISLDWYPELMKFAARQLSGQNKILHAGIAWTCAAHTAITTRKGADAWMASMGIGPGQPDWLKSCDIGTSSLTIYATLKSAPQVLRGVPPEVPYDDDDFGRCLRLVTKWHPEFRADLHIVADVHPAWQPIVERWEEFAALHLGGNYEGLTEALRKINGGRIG